MGKYTQSYRILSIEGIKKAFYKEMEENGYFVLYGLAGSIPFKRVNVLGFVTNTYIAPDEKYGFFVIDDGSDEIIVKVFKDINFIKDLKKGDLVMVLGRVSKYNEEPQIIMDRMSKIDDFNRIISRLLEINKVKDMFDRISQEIKEMEGQEKDAIVANLYEKYNLSVNELAMLVYGDEEMPVEIQEDQSKKEEGIDLKEIKAEIVQVLREKDTGEGVSYEEVISSLSYPQQLIEDAIVELLTEGSCYEPRPGLLKILE